MKTEAHGLGFMKSLRDFYFMRAAARLPFRRENKLDRQTEPGLCPGFRAFGGFCPASGCYSILPRSRMV
jgi:hypothetical protein